MDDETVLVRRAKGGDQTAMDALIRANQGRVRAFLGLRLHDTSMADDLAQDCFIFACQHLDRFREGSPFYAWLRGIAHNLLRNHLRKRKALNVDPHNLAGLIEEAASEEAERCDESQYLPALRRCLERLGGKASTAVQGHYYDEQPLDRVAAAMGSNTNAVTVMLSRARKALKGCIDKQLQATTT